MPAINAPHRAQTTVDLTGALGAAVIHDLLAGPTGSPYDARKITSWVAGSPVYENDPTNYSTGAMSTGIGYGANKIIRAPMKPGNREAIDFGMPFTSDSAEDNESSILLGLYAAAAAPPPGNHFGTLLFIGGGYNVVDPVTMASNPHPWSGLHTAALMGGSVVRDALPVTPVAGEYIGNWTNMTDLEGVASAAPGAAVDLGGNQFRNICDVTILEGETAVWGGDFLAPIAEYPNHNAPYPEL